MPATARDLALDRFRWIGGHADVWRVFRDAGALAAVVAALAEPFRREKVDAVCGVEARGFLLGAAVAVELGVGFLPVRKGTGLFPGEKTFGQTAPDYRGLRHTLRLQRSAVTAGDRVLLVDDWVETGTQATTVKSLIEQCGGSWVGCSVLIDQLAPEVREQLSPVHALLDADRLPPVTEDGEGE
ncbi:MAG TPA: phosphoribosyltransferase family protein [Actinospica sp.]|jgi:adenine phosphoribosyltransferase|nr:phosphoribosyltransferase family protein [Actinospica sp.]